MKSARTGSPLWSLVVATLAACSLVALPANRGIAAEANVTAAIDTSNRSDVWDSYLTRYFPAISTPAKWTGNIATCDPGMPSDATQESTEDALNFVRAMAGLDPVTLDPTMTPRLQKSALIMAGQNDLSHSPPNTWACWSADGAAGAGVSNLALGSGGAHAIDLYMYDPGANNTSAGHRAWILTPTTTTLGSGSTPRSNALQVINTASNPAATDPDWVAWPTSGYFPLAMEPGGRWSLRTSKDDLDLSTATVIVSGPQGTQTATFETRYSSYLVFRVKGLEELYDATTDVTYTVTVSGIKQAGAPAPDHTYPVTFTRPKGQIVWDADPSVVGIPQVGEELTVSADDYHLSPAADLPEPEYRDITWYSGNRVVDYGSAYKPSASDIGRTIRAVISFSFSFGDAYETTRSTAATAAVQSGTITNTDLPSITGTKRVGQTLTANPGTWTPRGVKITNKWLRDGKVIRSATAKKYTLRKADRGHRISVRVTAVKPGYTRTKATSTETKTTRRRL